MGLHQPPDLPTLKAYPTSGVGGRFDFFFAKMKRKDKVKDTQSNFLICYAFLSTRAKTVWGRGLLQPPFGELGLMNVSLISKIIFTMFT